jgi:hypothetical protein
MFLEFNLCLAIFFIAWLIVDAESVFNLGARIDAYLTVSWKFIQIFPSVIRMFVVRAYMLWKIKRELRSTFAFKPQ